MPVMDGIEATKEIRRLEKINAMQGFPSTPSSDGQPRTPETPPTSSTSASPYRSSVIIVALTASSLQSDRVAALAAGCNDFLTKPVSLDWLNSKIIEWGSIKALQMWADIKPEAAKSIMRGQDAQAQNVARRLHVPEGRASPGETPSRTPSVPRSPTSAITPIGHELRSIAESTLVPRAPLVREVELPTVGASAPGTFGIVAPGSPAAIPDSHSEALREDGPESETGQRAAPAAHNGDGDIHDGPPPETEGAGAVEPRPPGIVG